MLQIDPDTTTCLEAPLTELEAFCRQEFDRLVGLLSLYCGNSFLAEDLAQEALATACRDWRQVRTSSNPSGWLYRVGINLCNSHFRRRAAERRAKAKLHATPQAPDPDWAISVRQAVSLLPRRQRTALVLRYYGELTVREAADLMGCAEGTVRALTHKALTNLRSSPSLHQTWEAPNAV